MARRLDVRRQAISNASVDGKFPAKWYRVVKAMCEEAGIDCPDDIFSFIDPADQDCGSAHTQGDAA